MIRSKGWETFCESPEAVPCSIVLEFYANASVEKNGYSYVRGMTVDYTPQAIRRVIGQKPKPRNQEDWTFKPREEVDLDYIMAELTAPGARWKKKGFTDEYLTFLLRR